MNWSRILSGGAPASADDLGQRDRARREHPHPRSTGQARARAARDSIVFYTPDVCFDDAREYIPRVLSSRGGDSETGMAVLDQIGLLVQRVG